MGKVLQINSVVNKGSTGRIAEEIGNVLMANGWESAIAYGRPSNPSNSISIEIGDFKSRGLHFLKSTFLDSHGLSSSKATLGLIERIKEEDPDIIHLHNIHGYFLNFEILFSFLSKSKIPLVWTLHDCWPFTGHCAYFSYAECEKWKTKEGCSSCPQINKYPKSFIDKSKRNFDLKKKVFNSVNSITFVPVSYWLKNELKQSFLGNHDSVVIYNGINLAKFKPNGDDLEKQRILPNKFILLGVNTNWTERKGISEFIELSKIISEEEQIVLVGLPKKLLKSLPENIIGFERTESVEELVQFYNEADVLINPTLEDNYPTSNLEAISCGIPVITYDTGGSPESIGEGCGFKVPKKRIDLLYEKVQEIKKNGSEFYRNKCRNFALENFDQKIKFKQYLDLYQSLLKTEVGK